MDEDREQAGVNSPALREPPAKRLQIGGGAVNEQECVYVERAHERQLLSWLQASESCIVVAPRQLGKSSLVMWCARRLLDAGTHKLAIVDLSGALGSPSKQDDWFIGFLKNVLDDIGLPRELASNYWNSSTAPPAERLAMFLRDEVATAVDSGVVIFVDELDRVRSLEYTSEFFRALEYMHRQRESDPLFRKVAFCFAGAAAVEEVVDRATAPELGHVVNLADFDATEHDLSGIERCLCSTPEDAARILDRILYWTGGHPFLTALLGDAVIGASVDEVDRVVCEMFARDTPNNAVKVHYNEIRFRAGKREVLEAYRALLKDEPPTNVAAHDLVQLRMSGLGKTTSDGRWVVRNRIYARWLDDTWIDELLAEQHARDLRTAEADGSRSDSGRAAG